MKKLDFYLASPLGFSEAGRFFMYEKLIPLVESEGITVIDPWKLTSQEHIDRVNSLKGVKKKQALIELQNLIGRNNEGAISRADGLIAVLDGYDVDSGTASEIGFATAIGKPIFGYRNDFRCASDIESGVVNLQVEYFINKSGGRITRSLDELKSVLGNYKRKRFLSSLH